MQRVSIGRALVRSPRIFLMDEPLSSLDAKLRAELRIELKRIHNDLGATFLYVTHDQIEAMTMASHVGVLDHGRLVQFGTPREIYEDPVSTYVATRLGHPASTCCQPRSSAGAPPGPPRSACAPSTSARRRPRGPGPPGRASGRPDAPAPVDGRARDRHADRCPHPARPRDSLAISPVNPLWFDASGARIR